MILILADELLVHFRKKCRNVGSAGWETASHFSFAIDRKRSMRFTDLQILPTSNHQSLCEVVQSCSTPEDTLLPVSLENRHRGSWHASAKRVLVFTLLKKT